MAAARAGRTAGSTPGPAGASRRLADGPGKFCPSNSPARRPVIRASVRELEARRLAPCTPGDAASPTAYRPATEGPPALSAPVPPQAWGPPAAAADGPAAPPGP